MYIAESPLYEITTKTALFAYTEPEETAFLEEIGEEKCAIHAPKVWVRTTPR